MSVRVILPSNNSARLDAFLASAERSERGSSASVIVGDSIGMLPSALRTRVASVIDLPCGEDFVLARAYNMLIDAAYPFDVAVFNDDFEILTRDWLTRLNAVAANWPEAYGVINMHQHGTPVPTNLSECRLSVLNMAVYRRATCDKVHFDERYIGYGHEDIDYCLQLWHAGHRIGQSNLVTIRHAGTCGFMQRWGSYDAVIERYVTNYDLFYTKWGITPNAAREARFFDAEDHVGGRCSCRKVVA